MPHHFSRAWNDVVAILKRAAPAATGASGDAQRMSRRLKTTSLAAVLVLLIVAWGLYRSDAVKPAERAAPLSTQADHELAEAKQALEDERVKSQKLARQLSTAWAELQSQAVALGDGAARSQELADLRQALQLQSEAYREILAMESARSRKLEDQLEAQLNEAAPPGDTGKEPPLASAAPTKPVVIAAPKPEVVAAPRPEVVAAPKPEVVAAPKPEVVAAAKPEVVAAPKPEVVAAAKPEVIEPAKAVATAPAEVIPIPVPARPAPSEGNKLATAAATQAVEAPATVERLRLMEQARLLIRRGDIGAARTVLEHAAGMGDAAALFALAETYDPNVLSAWGTLGTVGDAEKAEELYAAAVASAVQEVDGRLSALKQ
jgi:hypothetical protein